MWKIINWIVFRFKNKPYEIRFDTIKRRIKIDEPLFGSFDDRGEPLICFRVKK